MSSSDRLDRIEVRGFKSIREMDLKLRPLNVLIGANGAGKSNFVAVFELLNQIIEGNLQVHVARAGFADALLHFGSKVTREISLTLHFGRNGYQARLAPSAEGGILFFVAEECWYHGPGYDRPYEVPLGTAHRETRLYEEARTHPGGIASYVLKTLKSWKVYHFHDTSHSARMKQAGDVNDNAFLRDDASNLAAYLYLLRETQREHYDRIVGTIRLAAPFFDDFDLKPSPFNPDKILLEWRQRGTDSYFGASSLSDGTLRFICLTTLLMQPTLPSMILIDEPELGLHPYAIVLLAEMLKSAATQTQVIVSTQSVPLVSQFAPEDVIVVEQQAGESAFRRLDSQSIEAWLEEYSLGEIWEKNLIGGTP